MSCVARHLCLACSLRTHLTDTPMAPAVREFVRQPFPFSRTIQRTCHSFSFMLSGRSRLTYLPGLLRQTHTPLSPVTVRLICLIRLADLTYSDRG